MSFDLEILVKKQKKPSKLPFPSSIELRNEIEHEETKRYYKIWPNMTNEEGIWYSLVKEHNDLLNAFLICCPDYEIDEENIQYPYWIEDEEIKYYLTPLVINEEYKTEFKAIINFLLEQSPAKTIMLLAGYQGGEKEIICGTLSVDEFFILLENRKILFNVCYVITSEKN